MPKLRLKRTPEEQVAHEVRKKLRRETKGKAKRRHDENWHSSDDEPRGYNKDTSAGSSTVRFDDDYFEIEIEEARFREKMADAFREDERLDSVEARLNEYAYIPTHLGGSGAPRRVYHDLEDNSFMKLNPNQMEDEEYAEWIRAGMYRKTHAIEHAERLQKQKEREERRAREKAIKAETVRLQKEADRAKKRKLEERTILLWAEARDRYESQWKAISLLAEDSPPHMRFHDVPWPVFLTHNPRADPDRRPALVILDDLTAEAISKFLHSFSGEDVSDDSEPLKKSRKDKVRETFLRFHPDKFEGRLMKFVKEDDRTQVKEGLIQVVRVLNEMLVDPS